MTVEKLIKELLDCPGTAVVCASDNEQGEYEIETVKIDHMPQNNPYIDHSTNANIIVVLY